MAGSVDATYTNTATTSSASLTVTITGGAAIGKKLVVAAVRTDVSGNAQGVASISDSKGNTWTLHDAISRTLGTSEVSFHHCDVTTALAASDTVTITWNQSTNRRLAAVHVVSGLASGGPDAHSNATIGSTTASYGSTGSSTTPSATTGTTTTANGMTFGAVTASSGATSVAPGTGYTELADLVTAAGSADRRLETEWAATTTTGTKSAGMTLGSSVVWAAAAVHYGDAVTVTANAGTDQTGLEPFSTVTLTGSDTGTVTSRAWSQVDGTTAVLRAAPVYTEDFSGGTWPGWSFDSGRFTVANGLLAASTGSYTDAVKTATVDLTGRAFEFQVDPGSTSVGHSHSLHVGYKLDANNYAQWVISPGESGNQVFTRTTVAGVQTQNALPLLPAGTWYRIRKSGTSMLFETSPDRLTWTTQQTHTSVTWAITALTLWVQVGFWDTETDTATFRLDNLRVQSTSADTASVEVQLPGTNDGETSTFRYTVNGSVTDDVDLSIVAATLRVADADSWNPAQLRSLP